MTFTWTDFPEKWDDEKAVSSLSLKVPDQVPENHLFIQGDNYPVLQKLSGTLAEKIDIIYIDPPYNTGNAFTYNDSFGSRNDNHSAWLSFMSRRLGLAKELLCKSGCIFIAIDQSELYVLKLLCDQIFGEENFVNDFMWLHGKGKKDTWSRTLQEHTLCYAKDKSSLKPFTETQITTWAKRNMDDDPRGNWFNGSISFSEKRSNPSHKNYFTITSPSGIKWTRQWLCSKEEMDELLKDNRIYFGKAPDYNKVPRVKIFNDENKEIIPKNIIDKVSSTRHAKEHLENLLGIKNIFDNPKPVDLIAHLIEITQMKDDAVIMDFFAGSGTTFEAVLELNKKDGGKRKCILVQKAEETRTDNPLGTIADITWERMKKNAADYKIPEPEKIVLSGE